MHELVGPSGTVLGIDHIDDLVQQSQNNLCKSRKTAAALEQGQIKVVCGDGRAGASHHDLPQGGFDAIHVGAAAPEIPQVLIDQLKSPGRCFIPVGTVRQAVYQIDKDAQGESWRRIDTCESIDVQSLTPPRMPYRPLHEEGIVRC